MPTLTIIREVALAIRHLKDGRGLCQNWNREYVLCQVARTDDQIVITAATFDALRKARLIRRCGPADPYSWWSNWYGRRNTWLLSDAGNAAAILPCLDLEHPCYNTPMSTPRKKQPSRTGRQQTNRHFHVLATPLHLVNRKDRADQENRANTGGRRSTDRDLLDLYDLWLSLSPRERQVTYLACQGCKNEQIAFQMGIGVGTVKSYLEHVYFKIDVRSKTELRLKFHNFDFTSNPP